MPDCVKIHNKNQPESRQLFMRIPFTKMQGLGNDFIVFDATQQSLNLTKQQRVALADRHFGIGCDQLLFVEASDKPDVDFGYRIFNADGGEVEQCGNGARCFARFVSNKKLSNKRKLVVETASGIIQLYLEEQQKVRVNMGKPEFMPAKIPFDFHQLQTRYDLTVAKKTYEVGVVSMGNPHVVLLVDDVDTAPVKSLGQLIEKHPAFPLRTNVGFLQIVNQQQLKLRVFERGTGETLACGTGACAAMVIAKHWGLIESHVKVQLRGGVLDIQWAGAGHNVWMTGDAVSVFEGIIEL